MTIRVGFAARCTAQRRLLVTYTIARSDNGVHICSVETAANGIRCQWRVPRVGRGWCGRRCGVAVRGAIAEYAEIEGVILPFLTLDALQIDHSGTVLIVCADPRMIAGVHPPEPSRVQQLVTRVRNEPGRPYGLSPHVIASHARREFLANHLSSGGSFSRTLQCSPERRASSSRLTTAASPSATSTRPVLKTREAGQPHALLRASATFV